MYCVNCGVKLADTETVCPLCGIKAYHPDITREASTPLYPQKHYPRAQKRSLLPQVILSALSLLAIVTVLLCDLQFHSAVTWSGFVVGALLLGYVCVVLPLWFRRPNPVIFVPCAFAAIILYLLYINLATNGSWFLSFAFPVTGGIGLIVTAALTLLRYVRKGALYTLGGTFIALGAFTVLLEWLMTVTFAYARFIGWSLYPLTALVLLGGLLIFLAICRPARETMERKFFI